MQSDTTSRTALYVNGEHAETEARTLAQLIDGLGFREGEVATAVNGDFVPRQARSATLLAEGDQVEIVAPRQGG
jgi:sulfur carrier protein